MVVKKKRECCRIKDHSPLGLIGIFFITAGVIIAIFDAKDALPNNAQSYVIVIGVILILVGVVSVVLAFFGYRRTRALARETTGKPTGRGQQGFKSRRVSIHLGSRPNDDGKMSKEPAVISVSESYNTLPVQNDQNWVEYLGEDNRAYQASPTIPNYTLLNSLDTGSCDNSTHSSPERVNRKNRENVWRIHVEQNSSQGDMSYVTVGSSWPDLEAAQYIPPVSTTV